MYVEVNERNKIETICNVIYAIFFIDSLDFSTEITTAILHLNVEHLYTYIFFLQLQFIMRRKFTLLSFILKWIIVFLSSIQ